MYENEYEILKSKKTEDEVKVFYLSLIELPLRMPKGIDNYSENILFEFKYDKNIRNTPAVLAQALYYCNALFVDGEHIPSFIALIDIDEVAIYETKIFEQIYEKNNLFSFGHASEPDEGVIDQAKQLIDILYWYSKINTPAELYGAVRTLKSINMHKKIVSQKITEYSVRRAYDEYVLALGDYLLQQSTSKGVFEFRADSIGKTKIVNKNLLGEYTIYFQFVNGARKIEHIKSDRYDSYWKKWIRIDSPDEAEETFKKIYDLLNLSDRRTKGQFYTPHDVAQKGWETIVETLGDGFWRDGSWRIWDCCAGTGNLQSGIIPTEAHQYMYLSTLDIEEVDQLEEKFPMARNAFQFDFINDNFKRALPENIQNDMKDENIKWLFFINPPYVESQGKSKVASGVSVSNVQMAMNHGNLGDASRELYAQFVYNIESNFKKKYYIGLFSNAKFISSKKFENFRKFWNPIFVNGFVINSKEHFHCDGAWPLLFSLFNCQTENVTETNSWNSISMNYQVLDADMEVNGTKKFQVYDDSRNFRNYLPVPSRNQGPQIKAPLITSGFNLVAPDAKKYCPALVPAGFVATMVFIGQELQQQNRCFLASGVVNTNHNNVYLTKTNYWKTLIAFALYKAPQVTWLENRDFVQTPSRELTKTEESDCVLYALLSPSNNTATFKFDDGSSIINELNPLDDQMFNFDECSDTGKKAYQQMKNYLETVVDYKKLKTPFGVGKFLGFYQYQTISDVNHPAWRD